MNHGQAGPLERLVRFWRAEPSVEGLINSLEIWAKKNLLTSLKKRYILNLQIDFEHIEKLKIILRPLVSPIQSSNLMIRS
jgi:hypothetical protein